MLHDPAELLFIPLDLQSIHIMGHVDAAFANNAEMSSQLGFIVLLEDKYDNASIINFG